MKGIDCVCRYLDGMIATKRVKRREAFNRANASKLYKDKVEHLKLSSELTALETVHQDLLSIRNKRGALKKWKI